MQGIGSSLRRWAGRASEAVWLTAAVAVPLAFNPWGSNSFELPKALLLRALVLLAVPLAVVQVAEGRGGRRGTSRPRWVLTGCALLLGLVLALATAFSVNPRVSLWGSYERQQGLLTLAAYLALFLLAATGLRTRAQVERLWAALVWGSAPVVAYGLLQGLGLDLLGWRTDAASPVLSTVGRANFLGSYLVLVVPLTAGWTLQARRRWPGWLLVAGQLACLALTQARGAWMGLGGAALAFGGAWAVATRRWWPALTVLALAVLAVGFVLLLSVPAGPLAPLARLPGLERLATLAQTDAGSTAARLTIWRATLPLIAERPWLGYGPETMRTVFAGVFPPQLIYYQGRSTAVDRAHNLGLDLAMSAGLLGAAAWVALIVACGWLAWQGLRAGTRPEQLAWTALAAAALGHLADLQFGFDLTSSAVVFWLVLALTVALGREEPPAEAAASGAGGSLLLALPPLLAALALVALLCVRPLLADVACWRSTQISRPEAERLEQARQAVRLWPLEPRYRLVLAWALLAGGDFPAAAAQVDAADRLSPDDPEVWTARGEMCVAWGAVEPGRYAQAEAAYRQALALAPNVAATHAALGRVLARQGRLEESVAAFERAVALDATDAAAYSDMADLYEALGREDEAAWARQEAARWEEETMGNEQ